MPYILRKVRNKHCYRVSNKVSKHVFSKCTTMKKAKKQLRLLHAVDHNKSFHPTNSKTRKNRRGGK